MLVGLMSNRYQVSFKEHHQYYIGRNQLRAAALGLINAEKDNIIPSFDPVHCPRMPHCNQPISSSFFWKVLTQPGLEPGTFHFRGGCSNHWATGLGWLTNVKSEMAWWLLPLWLTTASLSLLTGNTQLHQDVHGHSGVNELMSYRYIVSFKEYHQYYNGRNQLRAAALALITAERDRVIPSFDTVHCPRMLHANQPMHHFLKSVDPAGTWATGLGWLTVKFEMAWKYLNMS